MKCKHCHSEVMPNEVRPDLLGAYRHADGLFSCFDENLNVIGTTAEPETTERILPC